MTTGPNDGNSERLTDAQVEDFLVALETDDESLYLRVVGDAGDVGEYLHSALLELRSLRRGVREDV